MAPRGVAPKCPLSQRPSSANAAASALTSCTASVLGARYDYEHGSGNIVNANQASAQTALIIAAAVLLLAVDAWHLAAAPNAENDPGRD